MANLSEKMINLLDQIDSIDNIEDYKVIYSAIDNHRLKYEFATGKSIENKPTEEDWKEFILQSIYDRTGDPRVFTDPDIFLEPDVIEINITHYSGVKHFMSKGFNCNAFYYYNIGEDETYGLQIELTKTHDDGTYSTVRFEDNRTNSDADMTDIFVSYGGTPFLHKPSTKDKEPRNASIDDLYAMIDIIESLLKDYPDPFHLNKNK